MKKFFSKRTFIITGITYTLVALAFLIGYVTHSGGGFISFGPSFSGMVLSLLATPFILIVSIIYIIAKKQNIIYVLVGYLILTVGVAGVGVGAVVARDRHHEKQRQEMTRQDIAFIENTIGDDVRKIYPNAEFFMDCDAVIRLGGFRYENQPDFDEEIAKWREITQSVSFRDFPHRISVRYYFENARDNFAFIRLSDFTLFYSPLGMSEDGFEYLTPILEDYLGDFHDDFSIQSDWHFYVTIYKELNSEDKSNEEEMWQNFVRLYGINTELVEIEVIYRPADTYEGQYYDVRQCRWF